MTSADLTPEQRERYDRNLRLAAVGEDGQRRLLASSALVVGAGGLGSPALAYLAAAGVGRLGIVDADRLEPSNLNRQVLHRLADLGRPKAESAADHVRGLNPDVAVEARVERLEAAHAAARVRGWEVVLDCSDNFATRLALSDACWAERVPLVSAAAVRMEGLLLVVDPRRGGPCYRCLVPEEPGPDDVPRAVREGVFGAVPGMLGAMAATEAVKGLLGRETDLAASLLIYDALTARVRHVRRRRDPACPRCGPEST